MTFTEVGLLIGIIAHAIAMLITVIKLVAWFSAENATTKQRLLTLEHQVDNDVTGRRVVAEMRQDIASIKVQIADARSDFNRLYQILFNKQRGPHE